MATKAKNRTRKPLRGGNSNKAADEPLVPIDAPSVDYRSDAEGDEPDKGDVVDQAEIVPLEDLLEQEAEADACTCGADRTGPSAEAHAEGCPATAKPEPIPTIVDAVDQVLDSLPLPQCDQDARDGQAATKARDAIDALAQYDAETRRLIMEALILVEAKEAAWVAAKDVAKEAKEDQEVAERELRQLIKDRDTQRGKPRQPTLYDDAQAKTDGHWAAQEDLRSPDEVAPPAQDESWKSVPLADLVLLDGLPAKIAETLASPVHKERGPMAPISTVGELAAYSTPEPGGWTKKLSDLKGIGPAKVELIDAAMLKFWARWGARDAANPAASPVEAAPEPVADPVDKPAESTDDFAGFPPADATGTEQPAKKRKRGRPAKAKA